MRTKSSGRKKPLKIAKPPMSGVAVRWIFLPPVGSSTTFKRLANKIMTGVRHADSTKAEAIGNGIQSGILERLRLLYLDFPTNVKNYRITPAKRSLQQL